MSPLNYFRNKENVSNVGILLAHPLNIWNGARHRILLTTFVAKSAKPPMQ